MEHLNWYPGHMKKTGALIQENLKLVDLVVEVIDARVPVSSRNPMLGTLIRDKRRVVVLNKIDLADAGETERWAEALKSPQGAVFSMNAASGAGAAQLLKWLRRLQEEKNKERQRQKPLRLMVVGVPNVGKSSLINRLVGKKSAPTGDKPGVTKGKQWLHLEGGLQLLDMPGILWPKFEDPTVGLHLAFCGIIKDEIMDLTELAMKLLLFLRAEYPGLLATRYKLSESETTVGEALDTMEAIGRKRGFLLSGGRIDYARTARALLDEFRTGVVGKITIERTRDIAHEMEES